MYSFRSIAPSHSITFTLSNLYICRDVDLSRLIVIIETNSHQELTDIILRQEIRCEDIYIAIGATGKKQGTDKITRS